MHTKLFLTTFALIFFAELGDKTQLTAMARSATGDRWVVFLAAGAALLASTFLAVMFGSQLTRVISPRNLQLLAGALFLVFGGLTIYRALRPPAEPTAAAEQEAARRPAGAAARLVFPLAAGFEQAAARNYRRLAAAATLPAARDLFNALADDEEQHLQTLDRLTHTEKAPEHGEPAAEIAVPPERLHADVATAEPELRAALDHAIEHEEATAEFYEQLSQASWIPGLERAFLQLAREEHGHAEHLRRLQRQAASPPTEPGANQS